MAVRATAASEGGPVRTCVGCRRKTAASELLRVVVAPSAAVTPGSTDVIVVPDPRRRAAGRGAWVHRDPECVEQAQRRRAFSRALRIPGGLRVDPGAVVDYVAEWCEPTDRPSRQAIAATESQ